MMTSQDNYITFIQSNANNLILSQVYMLIMLKVCHNTCLTCSGPLYFHCITCGDSLITKRILNPSSSTCDCIPGNISVDY